MAENQQQQAPPPSKSTGPPRPTITLPPRTSFETLFNGGGGGSSSGAGPGVGFSPGPMTLVSSFFSESEECKSFSQLLAGAMTPSATRTNFPIGDQPSSGGPDADFRFNTNRPSGLTISQSPFFSIPSGLSPAGLLDSPGLFSPAQGTFGMSHQQVLAQVTAQAAQSHSEYLTSLSSALTAPMAQLPPFSTTNAATQQEVASSMPDSSIAAKESSGISHPDPKSHSSSFTADKPNDDGYNWRKYGQKQVKGSEFPRSYYKCTHPSCPVKKKVERSLDGQVTEIIYKGQHNHQPPKNKQRGKDNGNSTGNSSVQGTLDLASQVQSGHFNKPKEATSSYSMLGKDQDSSQATHDHLSGTSDSEEVGDGEEKDEDEPEAKRRSTEVRFSEPASSHKTVTEPRIIVQTTSEVDLLDDGYRWRKYGQKVVKGNPYPRSYYKCTTPGCNVRKHVERASTDPKAVITTYEGKHNHDVPASKISSHNTANNNTSNSNQRMQTTGGLNNKMDLRNKGQQQPVGHLRLKEEQIT